jgi:hypothetical protein
MSLPVPVSSWVLHRPGGDFLPLGSAPAPTRYEDRPTHDLRCDTCGKRFRGRRGRTSCSSRCCETGRARAARRVGR